MMSEKSDAYDLFFCQNLDCSVVTFIKQGKCPSCNVRGRFVRSKKLLSKGIREDKPSPYEQLKDITIHE